MRVSSAELKEALEDALPTNIVEDANVRPSHGIYMSQAPLVTARPMYRVYHDCKHVFTAMSAERAIAVLTAKLEAYMPTFGHPEPHQLELDAVALVDEDVAILAPWSVPYQIPEVELRVRRYGLRLLEGHSVLVDASTSELVVPERRLRLTGWVGADANDPGIVAQAGRLPVDAWIFLVRSRHPTDFSRALAVAEAMGVAYRHHSAASNLTWVAELIRRLPVQPARDSVEVLNQIAEMRSGRPS